MPQYLIPMLRISFRLHDTVSNFLAAHFFRIKTALLVLAHLTLFGFFFPDLRSDFGEAGGNLLIVILFLSPLSKIFRIRLLQQLMGLRRELGILFGYLVTVHGVGYLIDPSFHVVLGQYLPWEPLSLEAPFIFGLLAYLLTLPLLFTSNNLANRLLGGRNWKLLHRTIYLMALMAVLHRFMMKGMTDWALIQMIFLIAMYVLAKLLAWRNFLTPLVRLNRWVAEEYQRFKTPVVETVPPSTPPIAPSPTV